MWKLFMFEKPAGMRDTLPELYQLKREVREAISGEVSRWGYAPIETPTLEYHETVGLDFSHSGTAVVQAP